MRISAIGNHGERQVSVGFLGAGSDEKQIDPLIIGVENSDKVDSGRVMTAV